MEDKIYDAEFEVMNDMEVTDEETSENSEKNDLMKKFLIIAGSAIGVGVGAYLIKNRKKIKENRKQRRIEELRKEGYYICKPEELHAIEAEEIESDDSSDEE